MRPHEISGNVRHVNRKGGKSQNSKVSIPGRAIQTVYQAADQVVPVPLGAFGTF